MKNSSLSTNKDRQKKKEKLLKGKPYFKEWSAYHVMKRTGENLSLHDDRILLRANKINPHNTRQRVNLEPRYRSSMRQGEVTGYQVLNEGQLIWIKPEHYTDQTIMNTAYEYSLKLTEYATLIIKQNDIELRIAGTYENLEARRKIALDKIIEAESRGIIKYTPRVPESRKNRIEALRNLLNRRFKVAEYEFNVLFSGKLASRVYKESEAFCNRIEHDWNVLYMPIKFKNGKVKKKPSISIKVYDIDDRVTGNRDNKKVKLEITLKKAILKKHKMRNPVTLLQEPDNRFIMEKEIEKGLIEYLTAEPGGIKDMLKQELKLRSNANNKTIAKEIMKPERSLTERVKALEKGMRKNEKDIAEIQEVLNLK